MSEEHDGYENRETWVAAHWLRNNEQINNHLIPAIIRVSEENLAVAARLLESWIDDGDGDIRIYFSPKELHLFQRDVGSFWRVNWQEIIQAFGGKQWLNSSL